MKFTCVINIRLVFIDSFGSNLIILTKLKTRQSSIFSIKPGIMSEKLKTLMSFNFHIVRFFTKSLNMFLFENVYGIFFRFWVICKNYEDLLSTHSQNPGLWHHPTSEQIRATPKHPFAVLLTVERCKISAKYIKLYLVNNQFSPTNILVSLK